MNFRDWWDLGYSFVRFFFDDDKKQVQKNELRDFAAEFQYTPQSNSWRF